MTGVQLKPDNPVIDVRADQMLALYHQQKRDDQKLREVAQSSIDQQAIAVLQTLIATEFEPELLSALPMEFVVREGHNLGPEVLMHSSKIRWHRYWNE